MRLLLDDVEMRAANLRPRRLNNRRTKIFAAELLGLLDDGAPISAAAQRAASAKLERRRIIAMRRASEDRKVALDESQRVVWWRRLGLGGLFNNRLGIGLRRRGSRLYLRRGAGVLGRRLRSLTGRLCGLEEVDGLDRAQTFIG